MVQFQALVSCMQWIYVDRKYFVYVGWYENVLNHTECSKYWRQTKMDVLKRNEISHWLSVNLRAEYKSIELDI